jgi:hypothetical protein
MASAGSHTKPAPCTRRNRICKCQDRAAPFRRAREISLKTPTTNRSGQSRGGLPGRQTSGANCYSRALLVALLYTACIAEPSGSIARMAFRLLPILGIEYFRRSSAKVRNHEPIGSCRPDRTIRYFPAPRR